MIAGLLCKFFGHAWRRPHKKESGAGRQPSVQALRLDARRAQAQGQGSMNGKHTAAERRFLALVASLECLICRRFPDLRSGKHAEVHHIASGSSRQNHWLVAPLCPEHHRGGSGLHGLQPKRFCSLYRVPHETEYGLLAWLQEDLCEKLTLRRVA